MDFRPIRRIKQQLTEEQIDTVLKEKVFGTLAMTGDGGYPYCIPLHFTYDKERNLLYLHGAKQGHKIDAIRQNNKVCFNILDDAEDTDARGNHYYHSIVIFGHMEIIDNEEEKMKDAWNLCAKFETPGEIERHLHIEGGPVQMMLLHIDHMSGKRVLKEHFLTLAQRGMPENS